MKHKFLVGISLIVFLALAFLVLPPAEAFSSAPEKNAASDPVNVFDWALGAQPEKGAPGEASTPELIQAALNAKEIDSDTALRYLTYAFSNAEALPERFHSSTPWEGTLLLLGLEKEIQTLPEKGLLSQKDLSQNVQAAVTGMCGGSTAALPNSYETSHFRFEYGEIRAGLSISDYAQALEKSWEMHVGRFGWAAPPTAPSVPGNNTRLLVRIDGLSGGLYGYVSTSGNYAGLVGDNTTTTWIETEAYASCMVLNRDYSGFPSSAKISLQSTAAHEFHHMIQFGYGALSGEYTPDIVFVEASATWVEDEIFDQANDNYNYLWPDFKVCMGSYTASPYSYWITFRAMTEPFGVGYASGGEEVMQNFWEQISRKEASNMTALDIALRSRGTNLADAYHKYAIAAKFNRPCSDGYASSPFCLKEGPDYASRRGTPLSNASISDVGGQHQGTVADNFALTWIDLPSGDASYEVKLTNNSSGGELHASLVCDTGSSLIVTPFNQDAGAGQAASASLVQPGGCVSVVAVITNQSVTEANSSSCTAREFSLSTGSLVSQPSDPGDPPPSQQRDAIQVFIPMIKK